MKIKHKNGKLFRTMHLPRSISYSLMMSVMTSCSGINADVALVKGFFVDVFSVVGDVFSVVEVVVDVVYIIQCDITEKCHVDA